MPKWEIQPNKKKKLTLRDIILKYSYTEDEEAGQPTRVTLYTDIELATKATRELGRKNPYTDAAIRMMRKRMSIDSYGGWGGARDGAGRPRKFILAGSLGGPHLVLFSSKWNILHNVDTPIGVSFDYDLAQDNALTDEYINDEIAKEKCVNYGAYYTNQTYDVAIQECGGGLSDNAKYRKRQNWDSTHSGGK